jgi:hypothetical protein
MQTRVRPSALNGTGAVTGKGSALKVTDSNATARVEAEALISFGGFRLAASTAALAQTIRRRAKKMDVAMRAGENSGPLIVIGVDSPITVSANYEMLVGAKL